MTALFRLVLLVIAAVICAPAHFTSYADGERLSDDERLFAGAAAVDDDDSMSDPSAGEEQSDATGCAPTPVSPIVQGVPAAEEFLPSSPGLAASIGVTGDLFRPPRA